MRIPVTALGGTVLVLATSCGRSDATPGTDQGWVYGVVSADGARVTAAGRLAACAGCHDGAPFDRLFGPPS